MTEEQIYEILGSIVWSQERLIDAIEILFKHFKFERHLGTGTQGAAFELDNGRVLKITKDRTEAAASVVIKNHPHENVVEIYDVYEIGKTTRLYAIIQEKLKMLPSEINRFHFDKLEWLFQDLLDEETLITYKEFKETWLERLAKPKDYGYIPYDYDYAPEVIQEGEKDFVISIWFACYTAARYFEKMGIEYDDYHYKNIGISTNGIIKVFDLGYSKSSGQITQTLESLIKEMVEDELDDLEEETTSADGGGYLTPYAFRKKGASSAVLKRFRDLGYEIEEDFPYDKKKPHRKRVHVQGDYSVEKDYNKPNKEKDYGKI